MTEIINVLKTIKTNSSRLVRLTGVGTASSKAVSRKKQHNVLNTTSIPVN